MRGAGRSATSQGLSLHSTLFCTLSFLPTPLIRLGATRRSTFSHKGRRKERACAAVFHQELRKNKKREGFRISRKSGKPLAGRRWQQAPQSRHSDGRTSWLHQQAGSHDACRETGYQLARLAGLACPAFGCAAAVAEAAAIEAAGRRCGPGRTGGAGARTSPIAATTASLRRPAWTICPAWTGCPARACHRERA